MHKGLIDSILDHLGEAAIGGLQALLLLCDREHFEVVEPALFAEAPGKRLPRKQRTHLFNLLPGQAGHHVSVGYVAVDRLKVRLLPQRQVLETELVALICVQVLGDARMLRFPHALAEEGGMGRLNVRHCNDGGHD